MLPNVDPVLTPFSSYSVTTRGRVGLANQFGPPLPDAGKRELLLGLTSLGGEPAKQQGQRVPLSNFLSELASPKQSEHFY